MAKMDWTNIDLLKLMPRFMREDEAVKALSGQISAKLVAAFSNVDAQSIYGHENELSEAQCDELAYEWDIDWYDYSLTLDQKRAQVKTAASIKRKRGTKAAVEELLRDVYGSGEVLEWFEYGGQPYHFKLRTNEQRSPEVEEEFLRRIETVKNTRSVLDTIETIREVKATIYTGGATFSTECNTIRSEVI